MSKRLLEAAKFCSKNGDQRILFDGENVFVLLEEGRRTKDPLIVALYVDEDFDQ